MIQQIVQVLAILISYCALYCPLADISQQSQYQVNVWLIYQCIPIVDDADQ